MSDFDKYQKKAARMKRLEELLDAVIMMFGAQSLGISIDEAVKKVKELAHELMGVKK